MGNHMKVPVEGIGTYRLILDTRCNLDLLQTLYVPSISRNLVSTSRLDVLGFDFEIGHGRFSLYKNNSLYGSGVLTDGLYKFKLDHEFAQSLFTVYHNVGSKRSKLDENSAFLWHKRLDYVSKERLTRLVKNEILPNLDFIDLKVCIDCIKGKQTKQSKKKDMKYTNS